MIKALCFDVFGTVCDWRGTIEAEGRRLAPGRDVDWGRIAVEWSKSYGASLAAMRRWTNLDVLLASSFHRLAPSWGLDGLPLADAIELSTTWGRLKAFPDATAGFDVLKNCVALNALTNASHWMLESLADSTRLPWRALLSAEAIQFYKPHPLIYDMAIRALRLDPSEICMVAAHCFDLNAAKRAGMRTALIEREGEPGSRRSGLDHDADFIAPDILAFAEEFVRRADSDTE